jgi:hypothetical protein
MTWTVKPKIGFGGKKKHVSSKQIAGVGLASEGK